MQKSNLDHFSTLELQDEVVRRKVREQLMTRIRQDVQEAEHKELARRMAHGDWKL